MEDTYGCNLINTKRDGRQVTEFVGRYHVHILVRQGQRDTRGQTPCAREVTANRIVSAGESHKTQHFRPPFCTFNAQTARNLQTFL